MTRRKRPTVIYLTPDEDRSHSVVRYLGARVLTDNKNALIAITGGTGEGKSYMGLSLAEIYSKMHDIEFDPKVHIIHSLKQILELITSRNVDKKIKVGSVILFEEIQVESNARKYQSETNMGLNRVVSTFRNKRLVVLFTTPILQFIDKQTRMHFHGEFEVLGFDKNSGITSIKPRFLYPKHNIVGGDEFYRKCLLVKYKSPEKERLIKYKLSEWSIPKASQPLIEEYEKIKKEFNDRLNKKELERILLSEKQEAGKNKADDLMKLKELYDKYGEDYIKLCQLMPHISPMTLERMVLLIKRTYKTTMGAMS